MGNSICMCNNNKNKENYLTLKSEISILDNPKNSKEISKNYIQKELPYQNNENKTNILTSIKSNGFLSFENNRENFSNELIGKKENYQINKNQFIKTEYNENHENNSITKENKQKKLFENNIEDYIKLNAEYISEEQFEKATLPTILEIEKNLDVLNKNNDKISNLINEHKIIDKSPLLFNNHMIYKGSWNKKFQKEGYGILIDQYGNKYVGGWKNDQFHGYGRLFSKNGDYYEGEWINGIIEGKGKFHSKIYNFIYEGNFKNFLFHGKGIIKYKIKKNDENNNNIPISYEGQFKNGYKEGKGKLIFKDGSYYEGNFNLDKYNGEGIFKWKKEKYYSGEWKNNMIHGKGKFIWNKDTYYKGEYKNNMKNGKGTYHFGKSKSYKGIWKNNFPNGEGKLKFENKIIFVEFKNGKIIEKNKKQSQEENYPPSVYINKDEINSDLDKSHKYRTKSKRKSKRLSGNFTKDIKRPIEIDGIPGICIKIKKNINSSLK